MRKIKFFLLLGLNSSCGYFTTKNMNCNFEQRNKLQIEQNNIKHDYHENLATENQNLKNRIDKLQLEIELLKNRIKKQSNIIGESLANIQKLNYQIGIKDRITVNLNKQIRELKEKNNEQLTLMKDLKKVFNHLRNEYSKLKFASKTKIVKK